jgi:uncharacterized cupin superfamily protein
MILRSGSLPVICCDDIGTRTEEQIAAVGGLTKLGANLVTLLPGMTSTLRHWHEQEDELLFMIAGTATVVENDGAHQIGPGDICCWPAGVANAHHVTNRSDAPVRYLVVGAGPVSDIVHYPDQGHVLHHAPPR